MNEIEVGLNQLREHSVKVGMNIDLVQVSGGNTSYKTESRIWVKGSGLMLREALSTNIFSEIDLSLISNLNILDIQDFAPFCQNGISPSIETNFHILLKSPFVTHLHSLGSIALGVSSDCVFPTISQDQLGLILYSRPGTNLAKSILETEGYQDKTLLLQNHGVIFSGSSCLEVERKIEEFELSILNCFAQIEFQDDLPGWVQILTSGVLTPDEAVFLGSKPFIRSNCSTEDSVAINSRGALVFPEHFSQTRRDLAEFYVRVAKLIEKKTRVNYLSDSEVAQLLNWDREINRLGMVR